MLDPRDDTASFPGEADEAAMIARLRNGDRTAYTEIVQAHGAALVRYAARFLGSVDLAVEVVQDVYLRIWQEREQLRITRDLAAYLFWATRNRALHVRQSNDAARKRDARWSDETQYEAQSNARSDPHETATAIAVDENSEANHVRARILLALEALPPRCREIFLLVWDEQMSYADVASAFGISVATVRNQMSRAVRHLANTVGRRVV